MTAVRIFTPANPLAQVITESGRTAEELVSASEGRLEALADDLRALVRTQLTRLIALRAEGRPGLAAHAAELAHVGMGIAEVAAAAKWPLLGEGARGLLAMLEGIEPAGARAGEALAVHIDALEFLPATPEPDPAAADAMLRRLAAMRAQLGCAE
jgi:hypothetical protein